MRKPRVLRSRLALILCATLITSLFPPPILAQSPPTEETNALRIAVIKCTDSTGEVVPGLAALLERSLWKFLANQPGVVVVQTTNEAERLLAAQIISITRPAQRRGSGQVEIVAEVTDPASNQVTYRTIVKGGGFSRPGEDFTAQIERAVAEAAEIIAQQVVRAERLRGTITRVERGTSATVNLGTNDGLTMGTTLEVVRQEAVIGHLRVDRVARQEASGLLYDLKSNVEVAVGDQVRISSSPPPILPPPTTPPPEKKRKGKSWVWLVGALAIGAIAALAASGGGDEAGGGQLYVTATERKIPADGRSTTTITATLRDARGNPAKDGIKIRFQTNLGLITPAQVPLKDGQAQATLTSAPTPGKAQVTVTGGGFTKHITIEFTPTSANPVVERIVLIANPKQIPADGESTSTVTAVVADARGNPVPDGTEVHFTTSIGVVRPARAVTTDGVAEAVLQSSTEAGKAVVVARVGEVKSRVKVEFVEADMGGGKTLFVTSSSTSIVADGESTVEITALAKTANNNPVPDGTLIRFSTSAGTIFPATAKTSDGIARATLRSDRTPGKAIVTATLGSLQATTTVMFVGGGVRIASIFVTRDPAEIPADGTSTATITATARDGNNNPVADGTLLIFTTTRGVIFPAAVATSNGKAEATLRSEPSAVDITATVTVAADGQQAVTTVRFTGSGAGPSRINLVADRTNIPADGTSQAELRATLAKTDGTPNPNKELIFTTTAGALRPQGGTGWSQRVTVTTDSQGTATVLLRSTTTPDTAVVTVSAPSVTTDTATLSITFSTLLISSVTANPQSIAVGGNETSAVTATVVDTLGNVAPDGTVVEFSIVNEAQLPSASITRSAATVGGKATAIFRAGAEVGTAQIRAAIPSANAVNDSTVITITAGAPAFISVTADKFVTSAKAIGESGKVTITALVSDQYSNPVKDGTAVRFSVEPPSGAVISGSTQTSGGFASATMYPTGWVGDIMVIASTTGAGGSTVDNRARPTLVHMAGPPVSVRIVSPNAASYSPANPFRLFAKSSQSITVELRDSTGGPADPTTEVRFQVDRGTVSPNPATVTSPLSGTVIATFRSDQATPAGLVDTIIAVAEGVSSAPLYILVEEAPTD
ncbi:MAG: invasin domain 3-containing protein [Candidatus Zipacnadales bacterium]